MSKLESNWYSCLKASSVRIYERNWAYFKEYMGKSAEEILAEKKADNDFYKTKIFQFKDWLIKTKRLSSTTARTATGVVRGFFNFYNTPIHMHNKEKQRLDKATRTTTDYKFTHKDIAKMSLVAKLEEKYILLFGKSVGLRANDFLKFTFGDFRKLDLEQETPIYMGEYVTQKKGVKANPFIDTDCFPVVKAILEANKDKDNKQKVITKRASELSVILQRLVEKANIQTGNDRVRFHNLRKWLITRLSATMSESQWKQIVGKQISEGAYVSTELLYTAYKNALKELTVLGSGNGHSAKFEKLKQENDFMKSLFIKMLGGREKLEKALSENVHSVGETGKPMDYSKLSDMELLEMYQRFM